MRKIKYHCAELADPALYERGEAGLLFAQLRAEAPIWWTPSGDDGFWSVLRYADIQEVSRDTERFSSARQYGGHRLYDERAFEWTKDLSASLLSMDGVEHTSHRALLTPSFTAARLGAFEQSVRTRTRLLLDRLADSDTCDFVSTVAAELPIQVLAELMGVPQEHRGLLLEWSNASVGLDDPELCPSPEYLQGCVGDMGRYALKLWRDRLRRPGDDMISSLVHGQVGGENLTLQDYFSQFSMLLIAGNETVRNAISGGLLLLSEHRDQRRALLADPSLFATAAREIVRSINPVLHMRRSATAATELGGVAIDVGDKVVMWYLSGNFDETAFDQPERFDVARRGAAHLGFGVGAHRCVGARLGEVQLRVLFEELLRRFPEIEPCGPVRRTRSNFINGIKNLPVRPGPQA
jgi:linalool 8-monooxygenase